mgnify:FL=1
MRDIPDAGRKPLVAAAAALLALVGQLRNTSSHSDVDSLRAHVVQEVHEFEAVAKSRGVRAEIIMAARYALCTLLDETVLNTPWGSKSVWSEQTLLSIFHNDLWGGERFFVILDRMLMEPARNLEILELLYICLALGFEGKYRVTERGQTRLGEIQDNLYRTIRTQQGDFEPELSPHWKGMEDHRNRLARYVPFWVIGAISAALLLMIYIGFSYSLMRVSDPVYAELNDIGREALSFPEQEREVPIQPAPESLKLRPFLEPEIRQGLVSVDESEEQATITIRGDGLFRSGRATIDESYHPLMIRIAKALDEVPGQVQVIGHTDNVPIRSLRFRDNWDLSRQRAASVVDLLAGQIGTPGRFAAEGRGDREPLVPNDTKVNRARNRRVEIILYKAR